MRRIDGMDTRTVQADAVNDIAIAENGNASFSFTMAAVPNPCAAAPIPSPRATASLIPKESKIVCPKLAPIKPVTTTIDTARDTSAPMIAAIAIASGEVIFLDSNDNRMEGLASCNKRAAAAVPNKPPKDDTPIAVTTSFQFSCISFRLSYIETASDTTAGPNRNSNTSPAPADVNGLNLPDRYERNISLNVDPVTFANKVATVHVNAVQVTKGCTILVNFFGSLAPKTKLWSVVPNKNNAVTGGDDVTTEATPVATVNNRSLLVSSSENAFGGGPDAAGVAGADVFDVEEVDAENSFLTPITDPAVVNKVK